MSAHSDSQSEESPTLRSTGRRGRVVKIVRRSGEEKMTPSKATKRGREELEVAEPRERVGSRYQQHYGPGYPHPKPRSRRSDSRNEYRPADLVKSVENLRIEENPTSGKLSIDKEAGEGLQKQETPRRAFRKSTQQLPELHRHGQKSH